MIAFHTASEQLSSSTYDFGPPIFISVFDGLMCCGNLIRSLRFGTVPPTFCTSVPFSDWLILCCRNFILTIQFYCRFRTTYFRFCWLVNILLWKLDTWSKKEMKGIARIKTPSLNQIFWPEISYLLSLFIRGKLAASKIDCGDKI